MDRSKLPFRKNCEGYLLCKDGAIVVRDSGKGYLEFPGGGVDEGENPAQALEREAFEEAGVILDGPIKVVNVMQFLWGPRWAVTEKQKARYRLFKGEEMYFFVGRVKELVPPKGDVHEAGWTGQRTMPLLDAIEKIEGFRPFDEGTKEYREFQISMLRKLAS